MLMVHVQMEIPFKHLHTTNKPTKAEKIEMWHTSPDGSPPAAKRFIGKPRKLGYNHMCRLAAHEPQPGGFWN